MSVEVMGGGGSANLQSKSILPASLPYTANPDSGYDGFSSLTVQKPSLLLPENIRSGVSLFGVSGSYTADDVLCVKATRSYGTAAGTNASFNYEKPFSSYFDYEFVSFYIQYFGVETVTGPTISHMAFNAYASIFGNADPIPNGGFTGIRDVYLSAYNSNVSGISVTITPHERYMAIDIKSTDNVLWGSTGSYTMLAWLAKNARLIS